MEKFFKNPYYQGLMIGAILIIGLLIMYDQYKGKKNFYGLFKPKAA